MTMNVGGKETKREDQEMAEEVNVDHGDGYLECEEEAREVMTGRFLIKVLVMIQIVHLLILK